MHAEFIHMDSEVRCWDGCGIVSGLLVHASVNQVQLDLIVFERILDVIAVRLAVSNQTLPVDSNMIPT